MLDFNLQAGYRPNNTMTDRCFTVEQIDNWIERNLDVNLSLSHCHTNNFHSLSQETELIMTSFITDEITNPNTPDPMCHNLQIQLDRSSLKPLLCKYEL